jgi:hypothetical protein
MGRLRAQSCMKLVLLGVVACGPVARAPEPSIAPIAIEVQNVSQDQVTIYVIGRRTRAFRGPFASSEELSVWRGRSIHLSILIQGIFSSSR